MEKPHPSESMLCNWAKKCQGLVGKKGSSNSVSVTEGAIWWRWLATLIQFMKDNKMSLGLKSPAVSLLGCFFFFFNIEHHNFSTSSCIFTKFTIPKVQTFTRQQQNINEISFLKISNTFKQYKETKFAEKINSTSGFRDFCVRLFWMRILHLIDQNPQEFVW